MSGPKFDNPASRTPLDWFMAHSVFGSTVHARVLIEPTMPKEDKICMLFVKTLTNSTLTLHGIKLTDTVRDLMEMIQDRHGFPVDQQRIIFAGNQLEDFHRLTFFNITDGSTLHLVLRLRGGMYQATSSRVDWAALMDQRVTLKVSLVNDVTFQVP
jgi:hypothetical protein